MATATEKTTATEEVTEAQAPKNVQVSASIPPAMRAQLKKIQHKRELDKFSDIVRFALDELVAREATTPKA